VVEEPDVLVHDPRTRELSPLLRPVAVAVVVVVLLGVTAAWSAGRLRSPEETAAVERCATRAESAARLAENRLGSMVRYVLPALGTVSVELDADLYGLIRRQAAGLDRPLTEALARCRDVELWPTSLVRRDAREAYVAFLEAELARVRAISGDGRAYYRDYDRVHRLKEEAQDALARL
jgi:hypothetical protein